MKTIIFIALTVAFTACNHDTANNSDPGADSAKLSNAPSAHGDTTMIKDPTDSTKMVKVVINGSDTLFL
jgi:hypothetical protein